MVKNVIDINKLKNSSSDDLSNKANHKFSISNFFTKKNIKIIVLVVIGLMALILFLGMNNEEESVIDNKLPNTLSYQTTLEYCAELEGKLEKVLSNIYGAGDVSVLITVDGSPELVYATNSDNKTSSNSSGSTVTSSSNPIIVQTSTGAGPLILTENLPEVKGVIVVSSGAGDVGIKLDIINAVSTLLNISTDKISVLKGI